MATWTSIIIAFTTGIWGTVSPEGVLLFIFGKRYERKNSSPTLFGKIIMRIICILTLASAVYIATGEIAAFLNSKGGSV